jgi:hypothetical protein
MTTLDPILLGLTEFVDDLEPELLLSPIENEPQNQKDKNDDQDDPEDAADRKKNCHRHSRSFP